MRKAVVAFALLVSPAWAQNDPLPDGMITCASPVAPSDTAKSLMQRYGQEAVIQDDLSTGVEDITYRGVVLLPQAADWRIEVSFTDETMNRVAGLILRSSTKTSHWNVAGVTIGASLAAVQKINGKPFLVNGFDSDFAGFVTNWKGGALGRPLPGGCTVTVRFFKEDDQSPSGQRISSDSAELVKWAPVVEQIEVTFPGK
jgi:hypothetical protein